MQEIIIQFVYLRQQKMKKFSSLRRYWQIMGGSNHCYYFFGFSSDRRCPHGKKNDLNLVETRYVHFAGLLRRRLFFRE